MAVPSVTGLSPAAGPKSGGTAVTITGTNFVNTPPTVAFGATAATSVVYVSATKITCVSPAHVAGTVDVEVTTAGGTSPANPPGDSFVYSASPAVLAAYADIDSSSVNSVLYAVGTMVNNWNTYWVSATAKASVLDPSSGDIFTQQTYWLNNIITCMEAMATEFSLAGTAMSTLLDSDYTNFQTVINTIIARMIVLQAAKT